jgi:hypothetical protein
MTSQDIPLSPLSDLDPNMGYDAPVADGTPQLDRPLSKYEKLSMDPAKKQKYDDLQKKREWHQQHIKQAEMDRIGADLAIIKVLQGNPAGDPVGMDSAPRDPAEEIKHQEWIKKQADLVADGLGKDLKDIDREMDNILNEADRSCFPKGTQIVMFDGKTKSIDEIVSGDKVMVYDIGKDEISSSVVEHTWLDENNHLYVLNDAIRATAYERFLTKEGWKKMRDIEVGEYIFNGNHYTKVFSKAKEHLSLDVYNLTIAQSHNFFILPANASEAPFLVHNTPGGGSSGGSSGGGK